MEVSFIEGVQSRNRKSQSLSFHPVVIPYLRLGRSIPNRLAPSLEIHQQSCFNPLPPPMTLLYISFPATPPACSPVKQSAAAEAGTLKITSGGY